MKLPGMRNYAHHWHVNEDSWNLKFVRNITCRDTGQRIEGLCDPSTYTMYIRMKQTRIETLMTFFHEVMHAIEFSYELVTDEKKTYTYTDMHDYIFNMEKYIAEFFVQNWNALFLLFFGTRKG